MNVTAIALDSKIPNVAIEKIRLYHRQRGDVVYDLDLFIPQSDITYVSIVFDWSREMAANYELYDNVVIGGSGWDVCGKLPPEIDIMRPKINLGFASRGCNNNCPFCIVHRKEGNAYPEADLYDIWDGVSADITLLDNNILQLPDHFRLICEQARKHKIRLDFNQGLDHKLLNDDVCLELRSIRHKAFVFAFDHPSYIGSVERAIDLLDKHRLFNNTWYVLVGYNTTLEEDFMRLDYLKQRKQYPYVMRHKKSYGNHEYVKMARWANTHGLFRKSTYQQFLTKYYPGS